ncbi:inositol polyphosphate 5-phosphatase [Borealophlyctis nickersoniae]|nr:inositol polyphosphate 5-phosphatase [Borealophlyctis nickersoniae]
MADRQSILFVRENPRTIVLRPAVNLSKTALVFDCVEEASNTPKATARFQPAETLDYGSFELLQNRPVYGCLGLVHVGNDLFLGIVTEATMVAELEGSSVYRVQKVNFYSLLSSRYDVMGFSTDYNDPARAVAASGAGIDIEGPAATHPCQPLMKLLCTGSFYFSPTLDLTRSMQKRAMDEQEGASRSSLFECADSHFVWNKYMLGGLLQIREQELTVDQRDDLDRGGMLILAIQGYVGMVEFNIAALRCRMAIISRLSCKRAGTRFNARGVNDDGHVSNFVEDLIGRYQRVHIVNLLSQKDGSGECTLSDAFRSCVAKMTDLNDRILYTGFDFHAVVKRDNYERLSELVAAMRGPLENYGCFVTDAQGRVVFTQNGILRTNCLDCLDRTNVVQTRLARHILEMQLRQFDQRFSAAEEDAFSILFNNLWADVISPQFFAEGLLDDAAKSVNRFYINNFQDKARQEAIDILLGKVPSRESLLLRNPLHQAVEQEMASRLEEYSVSSTLQIFVGSWNVNGKANPGKLDEWLSSPKAVKPHLYVIGIQELIELSPGQYISSDTNQLRLLWEGILMQAINSLGNGSYVLLRSIHLVALGMFLFVRADCVAMVRNVETSSKKTGLGGMAANKGGIGVSLQLNDTKAVFITAHLTAGQNAVEDRNRDYWTINGGLNFRGRRTDDHDMIFWLGDFNYRINLPNEEVRGRVYKNELQYLYMHDQLVEQRAVAAAFFEFQEGGIDFDPTYKYDNGTNSYDTSEKVRIPAWTDRILYKGRRINLREYARGECLVSDHKPVRAVFDIETAIIDHERRDELEKEVYRRIMERGELLAPPQPVRIPRKPDPKTMPRPPSTGLLIDLAEPESPPKPSSAFPAPPTSRALPQARASPFLGFRDSFPPAPPARPDSFPPSQRADSNLPPPSTDTFKWWDREVDEAWIPREGDEKNPFYSFGPGSDKGSSEAAAAPPSGRGPSGGLNLFAKPLVPLPVGEGDEIGQSRGAPKKLNPELMQMFKGSY